MNGSIHNLKPWFVDLVAEVGLNAALELTVDATEKWTGESRSCGLQSTYGTNSSFFCFSFVCLSSLYLPISLFSRSPFFFSWPAGSYFNDELRGMADATLLPV